MLEVFIHIVHPFTFQNRLNLWRMIFVICFFFFFYNDTFESCLWNLCFYFCSFSFSSHRGSLEKKRERTPLTKRFDWQTCFVFSSPQSSSYLVFTERSAAILFCLLISALHPRAEMSRLDRQPREKKTLGFCFFNR